MLAILPGGFIVYLVYLLARRGRKRWLAWQRCRKSKKQLNKMFKELEEAHFDRLRYKTTLMKDMRIVLNLLNNGQPANNKGGSNDE
jgi:hypothetical protein